jgi:hypothetical protein
MGKIDLTDEERQMLAADGTLLREDKLATGPEQGRWMKPDGKVIILPVDLYSTLSYLKKGFACLDLDKIKNPKAKKLARLASSWADKIEVVEGEPSTQLKLL